MEGWHETTECLMTGPKTPAAKVRQTPQIVFTKSRKVDADGESLYFRKGFATVSAQITAQK